ncbi:DUF2284 domain-containing protein [Calderihabitans maritimus]|uniref:Putative metal-binding protein n=1 Tax=Calderihabitans maritimus TaxID=1246530 RepID=A0A1Z5HNU6_9FIRM|nr:DUF2284 domain-containing protein [Calderihabitans maritimus]GAW91209.1 putative metal-binding protein [Calderihabitans maritimus]
MKIPPYLNRDPQEVGPQYLEDLATGYWFSEVLFTAVETGIFTLLDSGGKNIDEIAEALNLSRRGVERFLHALCALGLVIRDGSLYFNTKISRKYLVKGKEDYLGDSILWRKYLHSYWQDLKKCLRMGGRVNFAPAQEEPERLRERIRKYIRAMDCVAKTKVEEIIPLFESCFVKGEILDVGAGSGAITAGFLERYPLTRAVLMDLPEVLDYTRELMRERGFGERVAYCPANILEAWPVGKERFNLVILSNIVHAYAEKEIQFVLERASETLKPEGFLLIHDFFIEHYPEKAALFDLNMFINTYNGKVFSEKWVREELHRQSLYVTELIPLGTDTALMIAAKDKRNLENLCLDAKSRLVARIKALGFRKVCPVPVETIHVPDWADVRCRFGCEQYGKPHCPPNSPSPQKTRKLLKDYTQALLLEGEPPTRNFQYRVLQAEKEAFQAGYYKAFAYWAGPCSLCVSCPPEGKCRRTREARPSMEGAGIDVFETIKRAGLSLRTLKDRDDFIKYFALLLLE